MVIAVAGCGRSRPLLFGGHSFARCAAVSTPERCFVRVLLGGCVGVPVAVSGRRCGHERRRLWLLVVVLLVVVLLVVVLLADPPRRGAAAAERLARRGDTGGGHLWALVRIPGTRTVTHKIYLRVWKAVAANPNCPAGLLAEMAYAAAPVKDGRSWRGWLRGDRSLRTDAHPEVWDSFVAVSGVVAQHPRCRSEVLAVLAQDPGVYGRRCVAANPATPAASVERFAGDLDSVARRAVAQANVVEGGGRLIEFCSLRGGGPGGLPGRRRLRFLPLIAV